MSTFITFAILTAYLVFVVFLAICIYNQVERWCKQIKEQVKKPEKQVISEPDIEMQKRLEEIERKLTAKNEKPEMESI